MMPMIPSRETTIQYITERRCESGGYCFYRLNEPNAGDTFFALASLLLLGALPEDDETTRTYLHAFQQPGGMFPNVNVGHAVIRSLSLLGERPAADPTEWVLGSMIVPGYTSRPVESSSQFEPLYQLTTISRLLRIPVPEEKREELLGAVTGYRNADNGFGRPYSTMIETAHALSVIKVLDPNASLHLSRDFLRHCEDPEYGFLSVPNARPAFLEHIHAGVLACSVIGYRSPALPHCEEFIEKCQKGNGGYVRSVFGGSATLENTWLAVEAGALIRRLESGPEIIPHMMEREALP
ncbi:MAG: hypothetical protein ABFC24_03970 [Methanoregulaceae archaeon]